MRRRIQTPKDEAWIDKQIVALSKQGYTTNYIMERYHIHSTRIARVRKKAGMILRSKERKWQLNLQSIDGFRIPEMEVYLTVQPRRYDYSRVG